MTDSEDASRPKYVDYDVRMENGERPDLEWIGVASGSHDGRPRVYDPTAETEFKGEIDHESERIVVDPESGRDVDLDSLGFVIQRIDEWKWLSPFAREQISDG